MPLKPGEVLADVGNGQIRHFSNTGTLLDTLNTTTGTNEGDGMCLDGSTNLYATQGFVADTVSEFNQAGNLVTANFGSGYDGHPESCVVNQAGDVFVGQPDGSATVLEFTPAGKLIGTFAPATQDRGTDWIDLGKDQCTLRYTSEGSSIKQFNVCTNTQLPDFATGLPGGRCFAHRILPDGGELAACTDQVVLLDSSGKVVKTYPFPNVQLLFAMNIDPDGTSFWTADYFSGQIFRVDIATGKTITTFTTQPNSVLGGLAVVGELTAAQDAPISGSGTAVSATEGQSFSGQVATFSDADSNATASEYSATINWGDGSSSAGTISGSGGKFTVSGTHTYAEEGSFTVSVTITDTDNTGNAATTSSKATVADAALSATGAVPSGSGTTASGTIATFKDADSGGTVSDYTASINWGDGTTTAGTVSKSATGFAVSGSHNYGKSGTFTITVTIKDAGGSMATATTTFVAQVAAAKAKRGSAHLAAVPNACVRGSFTMQIRGAQIASVRVTLDGKAKHATVMHRGRLYSARIAVSPGGHTVTVHVKFKPASKTKARTFHRAVAGCAAPAFTG